MILAISEDDLKELHRTLTEKILEADRKYVAEKKGYSLQYEWWWGYTAALTWVRDDLLELENPDQ
jgi:hypothetical protein